MIPVQAADDILGGAGVRSEGCLEGAVQRLGTVLLEQVVQDLDIAEPTVRLTMDQLHQKLQCRLAGLQQMLTLQIAAPTFAGDRRQLRGTMLGLSGHRPLGDETRMLGLVATGDDVDVVTSPFLAHFRATVLGRSNTAHSGTPPNRAK